jgi:tetratricopeptide (TPR) repeat protein
MRLDGWKSIAAHFGRERTTVIRWSTDRGMPVHRIPGSGRGSVYALTEELDVWLGASKPDEAVSGDRPRTVPPAGAALSTGLSRVWAGRSIAVFVAIVGLGLAVYARPETRVPAPSIHVPQDLGAAAIYVEARADWARRTPESIQSAIAKLKRVIAAEPEFAPAYSALADSYLLGREFGSLADVEAFGRAQAAVDTALKINPDHAGALRAKGFVDYWWHGDRNTAGRDFRRSLALDGKSAQTLFWYANALIDNGDIEEGMRRFADARLMEPASPSIAADLAWAHWSIGDTESAKAALLDMRRDHPGLATIPDYLSVIALSEGDMPGFVEQIEAMARLRGEDRLSDYARELRISLGKGPKAVAAHIVADAEAEVGDGDRRTLVWPAFVASTAGDRAGLLRLLRKADARNEVWGSAGLRRDIAQRWPGDADVVELLRRRQGLSLMPKTER